MPDLRQGLRDLKSILRVKHRPGKPEISLTMKMTMKMPTNTRIMQKKGLILIWKTNHMKTVSMTKVQIRQMNRIQKAHLLQTDYLMRHTKTVNLQMNYIRKTA